MSHRLLIASILTLLAACGPGPQAMPAKPPKPEAPPRAPGLPVTDAAVGPVTMTTPFDQAAIRRMFPDSTVTTELRAEGGVILVTGPGDLTLELRSTNLRTIDRALAEGGIWRGPRGEKAGDSRAALGFGAADCEAGAGRTAGRLICRRAEALRPGLVFTPGAAGTFRLSGFLWQADPS